MIPAQQSALGGRPPTPQPVPSPLTESAIFLVVTVHPGAEAMVRDLLATSPGCSVPSASGSLRVAWPWWPVLALRCGPGSTPGPDRRAPPLQAFTRASTRPCRRRATYLPHPRPPA